MTTEPRIAVTGSTGFVGGSVARRLSTSGRELRLLVRNLDRAPRLPGAAAVPCSYGDHAAAVAALEGIEVLFFVSGSESATRLADHRTFVDAAREAGVGHLVYTSFVGAAPDAAFTLVRDHHATEEHIRASGMDHTFLRDNLYLDFLDAMVGEDGVIRGPAGAGRFAAVARADVARTAATVLQDVTRHRNVTYSLTGPEALTFSDVAGVLSAVSGRSVTYHDETVAEAYASRRRWEAPDWQLDAWVSTYTAIAAGELAALSRDVELITGKPPVSLAEWLSQRGAS